MTTINQLIQSLNKAKSNEFHAIIQSIDIPIDDFRQHAQWKDDCYTRNCIHRNDQYEIILLCWQEDICTAIHNHGGQECWVYQLEGSIEERLYDMDNSEQLIEKENRIIHPGGLTYMDDSMGYHSIRNASSHQAMTLHIYNSPIDSCDIYDENINSFKTANMRYDSRADLLPIQEEVISKIQ